VPAPEPRTHYQVSFTSRQAVLLFVVVLVSLAGAYFLGILTGLAGRQPADSVAAAEPAPALTAVSATTAPTVPQTAPALATPAQRRTPAGEAPARPPTLAAREPGTSGDLQFFEDRPEEAPETSPAAPGRKAASPARTAGGWWVQVLATSSEREARLRRTALSARGYHAAVETMRGAKGPTQYRVRVGPYSSRDEAGRAKDILARHEKASPWIVPPGQ
jgi:cell division septation protein DedD